MDIVVNWWAVLGSAIMMMVLGMIWYNPKVFGTLWMQTGGLDMQKLKAGKKEGMGKKYFINFVGAIVMSYVLAHFATLVGVFGWNEGVQMGFWLWLGLVAPSQLGMVLWEGKPWKYYIIVTSYYLLTLMLAGGILAKWM